MLEGVLSTILKQMYHASEETMEALMQQSLEELHLLIITGLDLLDSLLPPKTLQD